MSCTVTLLIVNGALPSLVIVTVFVLPGFFSGSCLPKFSTVGSGTSCELRPSPVSVAGRVGGGS